VLHGHSGRLAEDAEAVVGIEADGTGIAIFGVAVVGARARRSWSGILRGLFREIGLAVHAHAQFLAGDEAGAMRRRLEG
jgi:hypothetical protein